MKFKKLITCLMVINTYLISIPLVVQCQENEVVYASPAMLTKGMMQDHAELVQLLLDLHYTPQQMEEHFRLIRAYWMTNDYKGMQAIQSNLQLNEQLKQLSENERKATVLQMRSSLIISLIEDAKTKADSRWYLQNYFAAYPPLIRGEIPFIQETADALIDCEFFINQQLKGFKVQPLTKEQREAAYKELAKQWSSLDVPTKKKIMTGASQMQLIFYRWKQMDAFGKANIKLQYVGEQYLTTNEKSALINAVAQNNELKNQQWGMIQNQLNHMKESTDIIMGRGIRWDPGRNRYVQDGGIVTEFW
jgi:hypothetical protein